MMGQRGGGACPGAARAALGLCLGLLSGGGPAATPAPPAPGEPSGRQIMEEVYARHNQYPYIYEEQSIVLVDRDGNRDTRQLRRYSRIEDDGSAELMLLFTSPPEVRGVALLATRDGSGVTDTHLYLPALGERLIASSGTGTDANFLGTDFTIEDLTGEVLDDYRYQRRADDNSDPVPMFVVDVLPRTAAADAQPLRRHYIRQDNYYIIRTDHFDRLGRLHKVQTFYDLRQIDNIAWCASMILMQDRREQHQTLIKIDRRVYSHDYVPREMFSAAWLFEHYPHVASAEDSTPADDAADADEETGTGAGSVDEDSGSEP